MALSWLWLLSSVAALTTSPIAMPTATPTLQSAAPSALVRVATSRPSLHPSAAPSAHVTATHEPSASPTWLPGQTPPLVTTEIQALEDFYNSLSSKGDPWVWSTEDQSTWWNFEKSPSGSYLHDPCFPVQWDGLTCEPSMSDGSSSHVAEIILQPTKSDDGEIIHSYNLNGPLPEALVKLPLLRELRLGGCHGANGCNGAITGSLPTFLATMTALETLRIPLNRITGTIPTLGGETSSMTLFSAWGNSLEGTIPSDLAKLPKLATISLHYNSFSGSIPSDLLAIQALEYLRLDNNHLTGTVPDNISPALTELSLANNHLEGFLPCGSIGSATILDSIDLSENRFSGTLCSEIGALEHLTSLALNDNNLEGELPNGLYFLALLSYLALSNNRFRGSISSEIGHLVELTSLQLHYNLLSGSIPTSLVHLNLLTELKLERNSLIGTIPSELGELSSLETLLLGSNSLEGSVPVSLERLSALKVLRIFSNSLSGTVPDTVFELPNLQDLHLEMNSFSGTLPSQMSLALTELNVELNGFSGSIPESICALTEMSLLNLGDCHFSGTIPSCISQMSMVALVLGRNSLVGTIPATTWPVTLQSLDLSNNQLSGSLPRQLADCSELRVLMLANNRLGCMNVESCTVGVPSGSVSNGVRSIPDGFWNLQQLAQLNVGYNFFTGTLPTNAGANLLAITYIALSGNRLVGTVPSSLGQLTALETILLSRNAFTGPLPTFFFSLGLLNTLGLDRNLFYGSLPDHMEAMKSLEELYLFENQLTSSLPSSMGLLSRLRTLSIGYNAFTGTIPESFGLLTNLQLVDVSSCDLKGPIPAQFSEIRGLEQLILRENSFTNSQGGWEFLDGTLQKSLKVIDLSSNALTGTLPMEWLVSPSKVEVFALSANCLEGSISEHICTVHSLRALVLDGLTSGDTCKKLFWGSADDEKPSSQFNGTYSLRLIDGTIPPCLFELPDLEVLHLAGNGLEGAIPDLPLPPRLRDLTLSYNRLEEDVPDWLQHSLPQLDVCDLSYNRLSGEFHGQVVVDEHGESTTLLSLHVNAFSGELPSSFRQARNISVLDGNVWSCNAERSDLPQYDEYLDQFQCDSHVVNSAMYAFLTLCAVGWLLRLFFSDRVQSLRSKLTVFLDATKKEHSPALAFKGQVDGSEVVNALHGGSSLERYDAEERRRSQAQEEALVLRHVAQTDIAVALNEMNRLWSFAKIALGVIVLVLLPINAVFSQYFNIITNMYAWVVTSAFKKGETPAGVLVALWTLMLLGAVLLLTFHYFQSRFAFIKPDYGRKARLANELGDGLMGWALGLRLAFLAFGNIVMILAAHYLYVYVLLNGTVSEQNIATYALSTFKTIWELVWFGWVAKHVRFGASEDVVKEFTAVYACGDLFFTLLKMFNNVVAPCLVTTLTDSTCFKNTIQAPPTIVTDYSYTFTSTYNFTVQGAIKTGSNLVTSLEATEFLPPYMYTFKCGSILIQQFTPVFIIDAIQEGCLGPLIALLRHWILRLPTKPLDFVDFFQSCVSDMMLVLTFGLVCPLVAVAKGFALASRMALAQKQVLDFLEENEDVSAQAKEAASLYNAPLFQARFAFLSLPSMFLSFFVTDMAGYHNQLPTDYMWAPITMSLLPAIFVFACYLLAVWQFPHFIETRGWYDAYALRARRERDEPQPREAEPSTKSQVGVPDSDTTMQRGGAQQWTAATQGVEMAPQQGLRRTSLVPLPTVPLPNGFSNAQLPASAVPRLSLEGDRLSLPWLPGLGQANFQAGSVTGSMTGSRSSFVAPST